VSGGLGRLTHSAASLTGVVLIRRGILPSTSHLALIARGIAHDEARLLLASARCFLFMADETKNERRKRKKQAKWSYCGER
jgi:hypothetical protein